MGLEISFLRTNRGENVITDRNGNGKHTGKKSSFQQTNKNKNLMGMVVILKIQYLSFNSIFVHGIYTS